MADVRLPGALDRRWLVGFDTAELSSHDADVLVVGSGIAGLVAALLAARAGLRVDLLTKDRLSETNTWYAQGGIAGAVGASDSVELHLSDTLVAGAGLCDEAVVRAVVEEAPRAIDALMEAGVHFARAASGEVDLHLEGGHSLPRVLHSGDATGAEIQNTLSSVVRATPGITLYEDRFLVDLLTEGDPDSEAAAPQRCTGALVLDTVTGVFEAFRADAVVLATGGCGQLYRSTTNPLVATGDGVAAAWRAGAEIADMEFMQFHPTAFDSAASPRFLITEALRGEGAHLLDAAGERFMLGIHPLADLAPRDIVTREIERVMTRDGRPNVWLDARHLGVAMLRSRFPNVYETCAEAGYDLSTDLLPVAPAAHYMVGGVLVDVDGRTSLRGLYASGEVAASGLHGANRLASNSLLEGLVFSRRIVRALEADRATLSTSDHIPRDPAEQVGGSVREHIVAKMRTTHPAVWPMAGREEIQGLMSASVGVRRSEEGLSAACGRLEEMAAILNEPMRTSARFESQNLVTLGNLVATAARYRTESRGTHWRDDYPVRDDAEWSVRVAWRRGAEPVTIPVGRTSMTRAAAPRDHEETP